MITSTKTIVKKKKDKQNPKTNGKSKAIQTKITQRSIPIHTHKKKKEKKIYMLKKWKKATKSINKSTNDNKL